MSVSDMDAAPTDPANPSSRKPFILIALVALADFLIFNREPGLNLFLLVNTIAIGLLICSGRRRSVLNAAALMALCLILSAPLLEAASWMGIALSLLGIERLEKLDFPRRPSRSLSSRPARPCKMRPKRRKTGCGTKIGIAWPRVSSSSTTNPIFAT